jgi:hypothetical protein
MLETLGNRGPVKIKQSIRDFRATIKARLPAISRAHWGLV